MSHQFHYVVMFDTETQEFSVDIDTTMTRFGDEPVFDIGKDAWVAPTPVSLVSYLSVEDELAKALKGVTLWG